MFIQYMYMFRSERCGVLVYYKMSSLHHNIHSIDGMEVHKVYYDCSLFSLQWAYPFVLLLCSVAKRVQSLQVG